MANPLIFLFTPKGFDSSRYFSHWTRPKPDFKSVNSLKADEEGVVWCAVPKGYEQGVLRELDEWARESRPVTVVVALEELSSEWIIKYLNHDKVFQVVSPQATQSELQEAMRVAVVRHDDELKKRALYLQARDLNRQLDTLTKDLELEVERRTANLLLSKSQLEGRLTQLREHLLFVKQLAGVKSLEDLLLLVRREFRKYHRLGDPCLVYALPSGALRLLYIRGGQVHQRLAFRSWSSSPRLRQGEPEDAQYLANEFGRPVAKVLAIPLLHRKGDGETPSPTLFLENSMNAHEAEEFLAQLRDRIQSVGLALDRLLLEFDLRMATFMWENTFDGIDTPIAIVDRDGQILRHNRSFTPDLKNVNVIGGEIRTQTDVFEVHAYPVLLNGTKPTSTTVNYYVNVTHDRQLQEKMIQTEKMAALGHLAGHIAHEINNPLTGIRSLSQVLIAQKDVGEKAKRDLREVEAAAARSQNIISNLLQFAKGGEGRVSVVDLNEVVKSTLPFLKSAIGRHYYQIDYGPPCPVKVDPQLLQQVVFNLIKNACEAMSTPGRLVILLSQEVRQGKSWARFSVKDTGKGIAEEEVQRIFTPFFTTKGEGEGTGLGLSLSLSVVRRFGGEISVVSRVNEGSEFSVCLPLEVNA